MKTVVQLEQQDIIDAIGMWVRQKHPDSTVPENAQVEVNTFTRPDGVMALRATCQIEPMTRPKFEGSVPRD